MKRIRPVWVVTAGCSTVILLAGAFLFLRFARTDDQPPAAHPDVIPPGELESINAKAEKGDTNAQLRLGKFFALGGYGRLDYTQAARWYRRAADQGNPEAQDVMGDLCEAGQGIPQDRTGAIKWYRLAAAQGFPQAQYSLGVVYQFGRGVPADQVESASWFRRAAEQGDAWGQFSVGQRYDAGIGVAQDRVESLKWLSLASAQGLTGADEARDSVKVKMTPVQISEALKRVKAFVPRHAPQAVPAP